MRVRIRLLTMTSHRRKAAQLLAAAALAAISACSPTVSGSATTVGGGSRVSTVPEPGAACQGTVSYDNGSVAPEAQFSWTLEFQGATATVTLAAGNGKGTWSKEFTVQEPQALCAAAGEIARSEPQAPSTGGARAEASVSVDGRGQGLDIGTADVGAVRAVFQKFVPAAIADELQSKYDAVR